MKLAADLTEFKRERILAEAVDLFFEQGYQRTSVEEVAARLGATKPFVYYHFSSKLELLNEICQRGTKQALEIAERALSESDSPRERLARFVYDFTMASLDNRKYVMVYFREMINLSRVDASRINRMRKEIDRDIMSLLIEGRDAGEFIVEDPLVCALAVTGMASFPFAWYREESNLDKETICNVLTDMALKMVGCVTEAESKLDG